MIHPRRKVGTVLVMIHPVTTRKKNAPADEPGVQKRKRRKEHLIHLDDLIPKKDVAGGSRSLFGASTTQPTARNQEKNIQ
jgi:hypothetical protein